MRALWENAEVKKASVYKIWMFVHYERELELFQEWPYFNTQSAVKFSDVFSLSHLFQAKSNLSK